MDRYLFLARSITHAQQMLRALDRSGIHTVVRRAGSDLTKRGCGYVIEVPARQYPAAARRLQETNRRPLKVFRIHDGVTEEVGS